MNSRKRLDKLMGEIPDEGPTRQQYNELNQLLTDLSKPKSLWQVLNIWHLVSFLVGLVLARWLAWWLAS